MFFFIMGINSGRKDLPFHQTMICGRCGRYGNYSVYMTYTVLSLFFIPLIKWNRKYFVTTGCCKSTYRLRDEVGRQIARGASPEIRPEDLTFISGSGWNHPDYDNKDAAVIKRCDACGFTTEEDYDYCPKCGKPF